MPLLSTQSHPKKQPQLTRDKWIETALELLLKEGIHSVQITSLSKLLGVTRGSFYWHFESRDELLDALIAEWRARNTKVIVSTLKDVKTLEEGVLELFAIWSDHKQFDPELDGAIRTWSASSQKVSDFLKKEDDGRVKAIAEFYERFDYNSSEAFIRARVIYFTQLSYYSLDISEPDATRLGYLSDYFKCFTGREIDPSLAKAAAERFLAMQQGDQS